MARDSHMTIAEARAIISEVWGGHGSQARAAQELRRGDVTISRWLSGTTPIGTPEAVLLRLILVLERKGVAWRKWLDEYERRIEKPSVEDLI